MAETDDGRVTVRKLIAVLQELPLDAPIAWIDFCGYDEVGACVNERGEVEIGPK
jgi:hypothetical protein